MMQLRDKSTLMQLQVSLQKKIAFTVAIMFALIMVVMGFQVPNPNMILITGLVFCSAVFGFGGGVVAAIIMFGYTLFFFSTGHSFIHYTDQNIQKVLVSVFGIVVDMLLICQLKTAEVEAFDEVKTLSRKLQLENQKLQRMSVTDALTGIRNRLALRQDYDAYLGQQVVVMMLDLNGFKAINDTKGHREGDRVLAETGSLLAASFGADRCYRYGGDEFLVIHPDITEQELQNRMESVAQAAPIVDGFGRISFSYGCTHGVLSDPDVLRTLIAASDEKMYEAKRDKQRESMETTRIQRQKMDKQEFSVKEMKAFLDEMSRNYDLARVVDPVECRIIEIKPDGKISMDNRCYSIWNSGQRCLNCSSSRACKTGRHQEKTERFKDNDYLIQSEPVKLKLPNGNKFDAVVELVNVKEHKINIKTNDRAAENVGTRAAYFLAHHDSLTHVLNADAFYEQAREAIKNRPEAVWVMATSDIMNFRLVNTLFGVLKGNEILIRTATRLKDIADLSGGLCGRLGGDQFAMLIPKDMFREQALRDVSADLSAEFKSGMYTFCMHFGVYEVVDPIVPVSVMCGRANSALRTIRDDMTQTVAHFSEKILSKILLEQSVIGGFDEALKNGEFKMYLQPLVGRTGQVIGAEALVRWCKPDGTILMPGSFIETLENAGLIHRLDMYIWEQAVRQLSLWKATDKKDLTISVNMSAKDFFSVDVYEVLTGLIEKYGVGSDKLRLEITETAILIDPEHSDDVISKLRKKGFLVEIDDFGKGYSSLGLLKNIQADVLKIDMSFLQEIRDKQRSKIILGTVIAMAESLGMDVITEGVETERQLNELSAMGCNYFQGYYFSRPIPVDEFERKRGTLPQQKAAD